MANGEKLTQRLKEMSELDFEFDQKITNFDIDDLIEDWEKEKK